MDPRRHAVRWIVVAVCFGTLTVSPTDAASVPRQITAIYQPPRVELAALARDGRHVAFASREGRELRIAIHDLAESGRANVASIEIPVGAALNCLAWSDSGLLIAATDEPAVFVVNGESGVVVTRVDLDASKRGRQKRAATGATTMRVLGFVSEPDGLLVELARTSPSEVTLELWRIDPSTGERHRVHGHRVHVERVDLPGGALLADRRGQPRLMFSRGERPQRFRSLTINGKRKNWEPLDAIVAPGSPAGFQITTRNFMGERSFPVGFDDDPNLLYVASNVGRDTYGIYGFDLKSGKRTGLVFEERDFDVADPNAPFADSILVVDRARRTLAGVRTMGVDVGVHWLDEEIANIQTVLEGKFPKRTVRLMEWDDAREWFLVLVSSGSDRGRYFVYHRSEERCVEYSRLSSIAADDANWSEPFSFEAAGGERLNGYLTWPHSPTKTRPPLIVWFHDGPGQRVMPGFQPDAQALAAMGFAVMQINYRGSIGFGRRHFDAIREAFDRVPIDDALGALEYVAVRHAFDRRRVAVAGEGFGGYLALRALQLHPDVFSCGVAINAPLESGRVAESGVQLTARRRPGHDSAASPADPLNRHMEQPNHELMEVEERTTRLEAIVAPPAGSASSLAPRDFRHELMRSYFKGVNLASISVTAHTERLTRPVLLLHDPRHPVVPIKPVKALRARLVKKKQVAELIEIPATFASGNPAARASGIRKIGGFLNTHLYDFEVNPRELSEEE